MRALLILLVCLCAQAQERKLKVHISVDMEGVAGVASADQLSPGSFEYERFRRFMTQEAVAAVEGAKAAGATHIVVADAHGNAQNLLIEMFPPDVKLVRSFPRRLGMMGGIDNTFDAAMFIGYHASTNNREGVRAHTFSSARLTRVAINGQEMTEGSWNAAVAGHFNVPVVFLSGDNAAIDEVRSLIGPIEAVETKKALGFHSTITKTPEAAVAEIRAGVQKALQNRARNKPYRMEGPLSLEIGFKHYRPVEMLAYLKGVERPDSHRIRYRVADMIEAADFVEFITEYNVALEP
jgi:D-amino peptidase